LLSTGRQANVSEMKEKMRALGAYAQVRGDRLDNKRPGGPVHTKKASSDQLS
jgi:hypothetical protein